MEEPLRILIVDDDTGERKQVTSALQEAGLALRCIVARSAGDAVEACQRSTFDCAIVDYHLTGEDGLSSLKTLHTLFPYMALIMITGHGDESVATEAMKVGALDYLPKKNLDAKSIRRSVENAVVKAKLLKTVAEQREDLEVFSQVLVHDLKGPIHNLLFMAALIEDGIKQAIAEGFAPGQLEEIGSYFPSLGRSIKRMDTLIETVYRYTTAQAEVEFRPVAMNEVAADALDNLKQTIRDRRAQVTCGDLPVVSGSPQLVQLLQNLIANAIKYCDDVPQIAIDATLLEDGLWQFTVQDNGIGIPEQSYKQVFEPFQRLHAIGKYEGAGLGLATCRKIVERHGGTISCISKPGGGTTFFFTLHRVGSEWKVPPPAWAVEIA